MSWIETILKRWHSGLESQLRALDQPSAAERCSQPLPAFSPEERSAILAWVRARVEHHFAASSEALSVLTLGGTYPPINLDVAFWVRGELRASMIVAEHLPLAVALERCTERALHDGRFRPITADELSELRIELTFFGPWQPLSRRSLGQVPIRSDHGYVATIDGRPRAWYLPMVHNALRFDTLTEFVTSLLVNKGGLTLSETSRADLFHFPTLGFMESGRGTTLQLTGPFVETTGTQDATLLLETSLAWMLQQEVSPGYFRARLIPGRLDGRSIDWVRIGFAASTLAEAGAVLGRADCQAAPRRAIALLERELEPALGIEKSDRCLAALYAGLAAYQLGDTGAARAWLERATRYQALDELHPIAALLGAKLSVWLGDRSRAHALLARHYAAWEARRDRAQLALYPELLPLAMALYGATGDEVVLRQAETVGDWYIARQLPDGSFPFAPGSPRAPYLRGSGKILEALSLLPQRYGQSIERGLRYARSLQYTDDSAYHIPVAQQTDFLGGFRHDACNREAWIDAAGHVILAVVRSTNNEQ